MNRKEPRMKFIFRFFRTKKMIGSALKELTALHLGIFRGSLVYRDFASIVSSPVHLSPVGSMWMTPAPPESRRRFWHLQTAAP